ncbi:TonB-dependent receptor [Gammaproteobacteria bacterium]|nr:TonB-dependent receptor [Gammaproteobacteria bacterium]
MKINKYAFIILSALMVNTAFADEMEEIIVSSSLVKSSASEIADPIHILSGDDISNEATQSLGETLDDLLGVSSADYGSGVGQPIIRGMSGSRVKILENSIVNRDVSGLGVDHINDVDLNNVQQIEVIRGPSSLLYTNGTVGGIINIVDNSIAQDDVERAIKIGLESQSVNDGDTQSLFYQDNIQNINISFSYKDSSFGNFDVPNGAIIHMEEEHHDEDEDHDEEENHDEENLGYLANSDFASESLKFGASTNGDWGFIGFSVGSIESIYGIPFHGEEHEDEHGEEEEGEHDEHEGERIFSNTESDKFDVRGSFNIDSNLVSKVDFFIRDTDYSLTEQHAEEEEHEEEGHDEDEHEEHEEGPTTFTNDALEAGFIFDLSNDFMSQKFALNFVNEDTSVLGSEAFMNPASRDELTLGYYISRDISDYTFDFGVRVDRLDNEGSISAAHEEEEHHNEDEDHEEEEHDEHEEMETAFYDKSFNNTSLAFNIGRELNDFISVDLGFASVERAPSSIELFMNGAHLATGRFEVGNVNLQSETSNNVDLTVSIDNAGFFASATLFANKVDNYIYLRDETEEEHEDHDEHGGLILSNYLQQDADLDGYEIEFGNTMELGSGELTMSFGRDAISGNFPSGGNIPRLNPARNIFKLKYSKDDMTLGLNFKDVEKQNDIGVNETLTASYQMLNAKLSRTIDFGSQGELTLSLFGNNMLDEVARNHSSFVKNEVPLPGRNYGLRFNLKL